jgi:hypothetical protein
LRGYEPARAAELGEKGSTVSRLVAQIGDGVNLQKPNGYAPTSIDPDLFQERLDGTRAAEEFLDRNIRVTRIAHRVDLGAQWTTRPALRAGGGEEMVT